LGTPPNQLRTTNL